MALRKASGANSIIARMIAYRILACSMRAVFSFDVVSHGTSLQSPGGTVPFHL